MAYKVKGFLYGIHIIHHYANQARGGGNISVGGWGWGRLFLPLPPPSLSITEMSEFGESLQHFCIFFLFSSFSSFFFFLSSFFTFFRLVLLFLLSSIKIFAEAIAPSNLGESCPLYPFPEYAPD